MKRLNAVPSRRLAARAVVPATPWEAEAALLRLPTRPEAAEPFLRSLQAAVVWSLLQ